MQPLQYGNTTIGEIPDDWHKVKIDADLVDSLGGFSCAKQNTVPTGVPHLRPFNVGTDGEVQLTPDTLYIPTDFRNNLGNFYLQPGDILYNNTNSVELVGKTGIVRKPMPVAFSNHINRLRVKDTEQIDPRWLALSLRNLQHRGFFANHCNKWIGQAGFSMSSLADVEVPLPSLAEQRRIVARIEALFAELRGCRALQERIVTSTNRVMESALHEVFGRVSHWQQVPLGQVFEFRSELIRPTDGEQGALRFVGLQHIESNTGIRIGEDWLQAEELTGRKFKFSPGQILYGSLRPYLNKVWIADCEGVCSVDQFVLCPDPDEVDTAYLAHYLRSTSFLEAAKRQASTLDLPRIRRDRLVLIDMPKPPLAEQRRIAFLLDEIQAQVKGMKANNEPTTANLEYIEQGILTQAFRGEL